MAEGSGSGHVSGRKRICGVMAKDLHSTYLLSSVLLAAVFGSGLAVWIALQAFLASHTLETMATHYCK